MYIEVSSFQEVGIRRCIQRCPHFRKLEYVDVYRGVLISGSWSREIPL